MMNRLKTGLFFSLICYALTFVFNAVAWIIIELIPFLIHGEYPFYESQGGILLFYIPLIFIISLIIGIKRIRFYFPAFYLFLSIYIMYPNSIEAYDAMFLFNFEFSKLSYIVYEILRKMEFLENNITNLIVFNGIFFIYQIGLFYFSNKIFEKLQLHFPPPVSNVDK